MKIIDRWLTGKLAKELTKPFVHILFGARQTGKTTLVNSLLPNPSLRYNLADPEERTRLMADPGLLRRECEALPAGKRHYVVIDEAQLVPHVFDSVQAMYDTDKTRWIFALCGSSARKMRKSGANLLPGRCILHRLFPLTIEERPPMNFERFKNLLRIIPLPARRSGSTFPAADIEERMIYGELPGVVLLDEADRRSILRSFSAVHLEEEIRRESLVKDWGAFVNFLRLAASEAGNTVNYSGISRETGLAVATVKSHYQLLEDMFIGFHVPAYSKSPRKNLLSTPRFFFFDMGIRHAASGMVPDMNAVMASPGRSFEQWAGIEIWKRLQYLDSGRLYHFRTKDGSEVDFVIELPDRVIPVEVKWKVNPSLQDVPGLVAFVRENPRAETGYVVCRCPSPARLSDSIVAVPWQCI